MVVGTFERKYIVFTSNIFMSKWEPKMSLQIKTKQNKTECTRDALILAAP